MKQGLMHSTVLERTALDALHRRRWTEACALATRLAAEDPSNPIGHFVAGVAALESHRVLDAQKHFARAIKLAPERPDLRLLLARSYAASQDYDDALEAASQAEHLLAPDDASGFDTLGVILVQCHAHARAADAFARAAQLAPGNPGMRFNLGTALTFLGDLTGAEHEFEVCIALDMQHWRAHHSLSQLRRQSRDSNHIERLSALVPLAEGRVTASTFLHMALAKELEDVGEHEAALDHCITGKSSPKQMLRYSRSDVEALFEALASNFPSPFSSATTSGSGADAPIFIVGMPRTGTTLVDRIISSHPHVRSAGELYNFPSVWKRALGGADFEMFNPAHITRARDAALDWQRIGDEYIAGTRRFAGNSPRFTDKLPHNFLYLGYIACALPKASIISVRRHPVDTCLSNFRQLFGPESPYFDYSYDLPDTAHYFILFDKLMSHWNRAFPGRILEVGYESLVQDQERTSRRIVSHCGLDWDDACLAFEKNDAPVATASAAQVRAPIYTSSLGRWKRHRERLAPMIRMLEDAGIDCS